MRCTSTRRSAGRPSGVTSRCALREAVLGLQEPMQHDQLAHQVVEGLAGGLPVRIGDRPDQQRVGLTLPLRGHPPRVRHPRPLAKLPWASTLIILWVIANDWVMANDLDVLDGAEGGPQPRRAASWSSSTSGTRP